MPQKHNAERWDEIFTSSEGDISEPLDYLVEKMDRLKLKGRALDLGCGAGRHCIPLVRNGLETHGLDISLKALVKAAHNIRREGTDTNLKQGEMGNLPYREGIFDLVVCINVIHHNDSEGARRSIEEIRRVLKPGGYLIATIAATRHYNYGEGKKIDEKTFLRQSGVETGILHYFMEEKDVRSHFQSFDFEHLAELLGPGFFNESKGKENYHWFLTACKRV